MSQNLEPKISIDNTFEKIVDILIRLGVLFLLIGWCFDILKPFVLILIWAAVISISLFPMYSGLGKLFGGRRIVPAIIITLVMLSILLVPSTLVGTSLFDGLNHLRQMYMDGEPLIPAPGDTTKDWPGITKPIVDIWRMASVNLQAVIMKYSTQLQTVGALVLSLLAGIGMGVLQFMVSILIAGVLLAYSESIVGVTHKIFIKLAGSNGVHFAEVTVGTVRSVVKGILGVAVIQAAMAGLGFFVAGVPFAGLWTIACLILAIMQVGVGLIAIPIAVYMFSVTDSVTATILAVWLVITLLSDNILKPILLGRGAPAPMLVIFLGSIGGFIYNGFLGLFLGAVVLAIGYKIFMEWLNTETEI